MINHSKENVRELVLNIVIQVLEEQEFSHLVINRTLGKYQFLSKQDRAFISRLSDGVIERCIELDYIINQYASVKTNKMKAVIRNILRMGVYQIKYMKKVPDSAACDEAVKLAKKKGFQKLSGFVNGVLRNISRNQADILYPDPEGEVEKYLSIAYSMPEWLTKMWLEDYGYETTRTMFRDAYEEKGTTIRCNLSKITPEELTGYLEKENIHVEQGAYLPYAIKISGYDYIEKVPGFQEGWFQVQDESSMLAAEAAGVKKDDKVLELCAAPGGKSLHLAEKLDGTGMVTARDLTDGKTSLIEENRKRHGLINMKIQIADALEFVEEDRGKADIVLADLPCSGLGIIGKKTDIKYKVTKTSILELGKLQREILMNAKEYVKPNGTLIYSTCTITKEENQKNLEWFLKESDFVLDNLDPFLPENLRNSSTKMGYLQLLPGIHKTDGFFLARMKKR